MPSNRRRGERGPSRHRQDLEREIALVLEIDPFVVANRRPDPDWLAAQARAVTRNWPKHAYLAYRSFPDGETIAVVRHLAQLRGDRGVAVSTEPVVGVPAVLWLSGLVDLPEELQTTTAIRHAWSPREVAFWAYLSRQLKWTFKEIADAAALLHPELLDRKRTRLPRRSAREPLRDIVRLPTEYAMQKLVYENQALWKFAERELVA